jgi:hypothetical protein
MEHHQMAYRIIGTKDFSRREDAEVFLLARGYRFIATYSNDEAWVNEAGDDCSLSVSSPDGGYYNVRCTFWN